MDMIVNLCVFVGTKCSFRNCLSISATVCLSVYPHICHISAMNQLVCSTVCLLICFGLK